MKNHRGETMKQEDDETIEEEKYLRKKKQGDKKLKQTQYTQVITMIGNNSGKQHWK